MRIAVLENHAGQAHSLSHALTKGGHRSFTYARGEDVLAVLDSARFRLLLVGGDGKRLCALEVLKQMRSHPRLNIPTMIVTARARERDIVRALSEGADAVVVQPFRTEVLLA